MATLRFHRIVNAMIDKINEKYVVYTQTHLTQTKAPCELLHKKHNNILYGGFILLLIK